MKSSQTILLVRMANNCTANSNYNADKLFDRFYLLVLNLNTNGSYTKKDDTAKM